MTRQVEGTLTLTPDTAWEQAIPLPMYVRPFMLRKLCAATGRDGRLCGRTFWRRSAYERHYRAAHHGG